MALTSSASPICTRTIPKSNFILISLSAANRFTIKSNAIIAKLELQYQFKALINDLGKKYHKIF